MAPLLALHLTAKETLLVLPDLIVTDCGFWLWGEQLEARPVSSTECGPSLKRSTTRVADNPMACDADPSMATV